MRFHIKRFRWSGIHRDKIKTKLQFPFELDLQEYSGAADKSSTGSDFIYDLTGVICHEGRGMQGGHYLSYCRIHPSEEWYMFNDARVSTVSKDAVRQSQAYILFYTQRNSMSNLASVGGEEDVYPSPKRPDSRSSVCTPYSV